MDLQMVRVITERLGLESYARVDNNSL